MKCDVDECDFGIIPGDICPSNNGNDDDFEDPDVEFPPGCDPTNPDGPSDTCDTNVGQEQGDLTIDLPCGNFDPDSDPEEEEEEEDEELPPQSPVLECNEEDECLLDPSKCEDTEGPTNIDDLDNCENITGDPDWVKPEECTDDPNEEIEGITENDDFDDGVDGAPDIIIDPDNCMDCAEDQIVACVPSDSALADGQKVCPPPGGCPENFVPVCVPKPVNEEDIDIDIGESEPDLGGFLPLEGLEPPKKKCKLCPPEERIECLPPSLLQDGETEACLEDGKTCPSNTVPVCRKPVERPEFDGETDTEPVKPSRPPPLQPIEEVNEDEERNIQDLQNEINDYRRDPEAYIQNNNIDCGDGRVPNVQGIRDLSPLEFNDFLNAAAQHLADYNAVHGTSHEQGSFNGHPAFQNDQDCADDPKCWSHIKRANYFGYDSNYIVENVTDVEVLADAKRAIALWICSDSHNDNLLDENISDVGIGWSNNQVVFIGAKPIREEDGQTAQDIVDDDGGIQEDLPPLEEPPIPGDEQVADNFIDETGQITVVGGGGQEPEPEPEPEPQPQQEPEPDVPEIDETFLQDIPDSVFAGALGGGDINDETGPSIEEEVQEQEDARCEEDKLNSTTIIGGGGRAECDKLFQMVNTFRVSQGQKPVTYNFKLAKVAQDLADYNAEINVPDNHVHASGSTGVRATLLGYKFKHIYENTAPGPAAKALGIWATEKPPNDWHLKNMLQPKIQHAGVGCNCGFLVWVAAEPFDPNEEDEDKDKTRDQKIEEIENSIIQPADVPAQPVQDPVKTEFMGIEATGSRFLIVADSSGSMTENFRWWRMKVQILNFIAKLPPNARVQVLLYSNGFLSYNSTLQWHDRSVWPGIKAWLDSTYPSGQTDPRLVFQKAFEMQPLPDAIYFLGGNYDPNHHTTMLAHASKGIPIHASCYDVAGAAKMQQLALTSGGGFTLIGI